MRRKTLRTTIATVQLTRILIVVMGSFNSNLAKNATMGGPRMAMHAHPHAKSSGYCLSVPVFFTPARSFRAVS